MTEPVTFGGGQFFEKYLNDADSQVIQLYNDDTTSTVEQDMHNSQTAAIYTVPAGKVFRALYYGVTAAGTARYLRGSSGTPEMWTGDGQVGDDGYPIYLEFAAGDTVKWRNWTSAGYAVHVIGVETTT